MTVKPTNHPSADLIAAYATGNLPALAGVTVAVHAETCDACRWRIGRIEAGCGELLASLDGSRLAEDALEQVLIRIEHTPPPAAMPGDLPWLLNVALPEAVARIGIGPPRWLKSGVRIAHVGASPGDGWRAYIVRADANTVFPIHEHPGTELVSVLLGAFHDGRDYQAGDFAQSEKGTAHRQQVTPDGPCIALVAAEAPARWYGPAKLIARLHGI